MVMIVLMGYAEKHESRGLLPYFQNCWLFGIVLALSAAVMAEGLKFVVVKPEVVFARLRSCPAKDVEREKQLQAYLAESGCTSVSIDQARHSNFGNVICTLPGASEREIVVGAHFDHVAEGAGAVDNWSGASLLPSLYQAVAAERRQHTFVFVGFYGEEEGMIGSQQYVHKLDKISLSRIDAMINMDTLGLGPTKIWLSRADPTLAKIALGVATAMKLPISAVNVEQVGSTDSESFREKKIPSITFHSLTQSTWPILHSKEDQLAKINEDDYYQTYQLLSAYLTFLDRSYPASQK